MTDSEAIKDYSGDGSVREYLSFLVGGQDYCVDIMQVREIRGGAKATTLPHSPSFMRGVINLRGTVLPIMDLACRLDMHTETDTQRNVIIVVATGERVVGLMVDAVSDILAISHEDLQPPPDLPADQQRSFVSALTIMENRMIRVLDLTAVVPSSDEEAA
ncbi:chemotaxis protein CheW [Maritimibacter sp. UBA3975]|uniref:chemotaxis protein CheW n=1 Tax=Maritimibacter sp. UBA3975 TaxID=1946833 RepID=UPI000C09A5FE|nr:chemotaxis protein CheW [Maritimibacter sp. UBA3975]MAM60495.1 chemotaxis protein CheW [Maritimibacter sp.]|tara:strand:+ start:5453 stop:5932 length:480 start_codon:yes stop_codon:yes gene_type:complete